MRKVLYVSLWSLLFASAVMAANADKSDQCTSFKSVFDDIYKRTGQKKTSKDFFIPPAELAGMIKAFEEIPTFTKVESEKLLSQMDEATTFNSYFSADVKRMQLTCLAPAVSAMSAMINGVKAKVYNSAQVQSIQKVFESRLKSEINSLPIGLVIHAQTIKGICADKTDKLFKVKCDGIEKFAEETRTANKELNNAFQFETAPFKFWGRFVYYWEKYVNKKDYKKSLDGVDVDTFERIFDYEALAGTYRKHNQDFKSRREEFEKRFFL